VLAGHDPKRVFIRELHYPFVITGQFFFVCTTLSVCSVWNALAKRVTPQTDDSKPLQQAPAWQSKTARLASSDRCHHVESTVWGIRHWMQFLKLIAGMEAPVAASLSALTVATMVSYFSPFYVSIAMSICCLVVSVSFAAAGSRMARLLSISADAVALRHYGAKQLGQGQGNRRRNSLERYQNVSRRPEGTPPMEAAQSHLNRLSEDAVRGDSEGGQQFVTESTSYPQTSRRCSSSSEEAQSDEEAIATENNHSSLACSDDNVEAGQDHEASSMSEDRASSDVEDLSQSHKHEYRIPISVFSRFRVFLPISTQRISTPPQRVRTSLSLVADQIHSTAHFIIRYTEHCDKTYLHRPLMASASARRGTFISSPSVCLF